MNVCDSNKVVDSLGVSFHIHTKMSQRPILKLKLSTAPQHPPAPPSAPTPSSASGTPKIKLKFGGASKATPPPPEALPSKAKAPRKPKKEKITRVRTPTVKKRDYDATNENDMDLDEEEEEETASAPKSGPKRLKLNTRTPTTPFIRLKGRGRPPHRPLGVGYDSECSDREEDPAIEEEFILRMAPGPDCDYLRQAVTEKRFGPRSEGGADVRMRFLRADGRRAVVTIQGRHYAACLADLPCVIEGMKSWDKRGWWKTADICQILLVLGRVEKEEDAHQFPLPTGDLDEKTWQYAHGLTPPMRWVRRRRFRKRISNRTIEAVEDEVERLLREDDEAESSRYEVLDPDRMAREENARDGSEGGYNMLGNAGMHGELNEYGEQDAEGDLDDTGGYFESVEGDDGGDDADDGLMAELDRAMEDYAPSPDTESQVTIGQPLPEVPTYPPTVADTASKEEDSGDDEEESSEEEAPASEIDEDLLEKQQEEQRQREEVADLEAAIKSQEFELERLQNPILRGKLVKKIQSLRTDLGLKMAAIGQGLDD